MLEKLMPKSEEFFDDFDAQAEATVRGARLLLSLFEEFTHVERKVETIKQVEYEGDNIAHRAFERLHRQFITPFDRGEIHRLLGRIDDVLDLTDATAERLFLYEVGPIPQAAKDLARILVPATEKLRDAVRQMREIKNPAQLLASCGRVKVANPMGKGVIQFEMLKAQGTAMVLSVIFASLVGGILLNLLTWWWGLPSSSSHALAGGLIGATLPALGLEGLVGEGILKIAVFIVLSPLIGLALGSIVMIVATWIVHRRVPSQVDKWFRRLQLVSSGIFPYSHGTNDAPKTMVIIAVVLYGP